MNALETFSGLMNRINQMNNTEYQNNTENLLEKH